MSHLYFNEESDYSEENKCEKSLFLHHRKKLNIFTTQLSIYFIEYFNRKSRLTLMLEAATGGVLWKKVFSIIWQNSQEAPVLEETPLNFTQFLRIPLLQNNYGRLLLKCGHCKNEARKMNCHCCRELDAMLIALAKITEREGSIFLFILYGHLLDY